VYLECNAVRSRNRCSGKVRVRYVCFVRLHVTVSSVKILSVAQKCLSGEFILPTEVISAHVIM
jgi:hypothetical protein